MQYIIYGCYLAVTATIEHLDLISIQWRITISLAFFAWKLCLVFRFQYNRCINTSFVQLLITKTAIHRGIINVTTSSFGDVTDGSD